MENKSRVWPIVGVMLIAFVCGTGAGFGMAKIQYENRMIVITEHLGKFVDYYRDQRAVKEMYDQAVPAIAVNKIKFQNGDK